MLIFIFALIESTTLLTAHYYLFTVGIEKICVSLDVVLTVRLKFVVFLLNISLRSTSLDLCVKLMVKHKQRKWGTASPLQQEIRLKGNEALIWKPENAAYGGCGLKVKGYWLELFTVRFYGCLRKHCQETGGASSTFLTCCCCCGFKQSSKLWVDPEELLSCKV